VILMDIIYNEIYMEILPIFGSLKAKASRLSPAEAGEMDCSVMWKAYNSKAKVLLNH
jgi:hypothetical protein